MASEDIESCRARAHSPIAESAPLFTVMPELVEGTVRVGYDVGR